MAKKKLKMSDIRLNGHHRIIAAPEWAFELEKRDPFSTRDKGYTLRAEWEPIWNKLTSLRRSVARSARPKRHDMPNLRHPTQRAMKICVVCREPFFGLGNITACTDKCANERRNSTRTRGTTQRQPVCHHPKPCRHCQEPFRPLRSDALYCSARCRIADHRLRH
jgi:hypothetical protein